MFDTLSKAGATNLILGIKPNITSGLSWNRPSESFLKEKRLDAIWFPKISLSAAQKERMLTAPYVEVDIRKDPVFLLVAKGRTDIEHVGCLAFNVARQDFLYTYSLKDETCNWLTYIQGFGLAQALADLPRSPLRNDAAQVLQNILKPAPSP
jgi:hypothetical protein